MPRGERFRTALACGCRRFLLLPMHGMSCFGGDGEKFSWNFDLAGPSCRDASGVLGRSNTGDVPAVLLLFAAAIVASRAALPVESEPVEDCELLRRTSEGLFLWPVAATNVWGFFFNVAGFEATAFASFEIGGSGVGGLTTTCEFCPSPSPSF